MRFDFAYVERSVDAAARLALHDTKAMSSFDMTADGFYRSFMAMFVALPLFAAVTLTVYRANIDYYTAIRDAAMVADISRVNLTLTLVEYFAGWISFPVLMVYVLPYLGLAQRYAALIIAYNWGTIIVLSLSLPVTILYGLGLVSPAQALMLLVVALGAGLYYRFYIALTALETLPSTAMVIAMLDVVVSFGVTVFLGTVAALFD